VISQKTTTKLAIDPSSSLLPGPPLSPKHLLHQQNLATRCFFVAKYSPPPINENIYGICDETE